MEKIMGNISWECHGKIWICSQERWMVYFMINPIEVDENWGYPPWLGKPPHGIDWYCGHSPWCMAFKKGGKHGIFIGVNANGKWLCSFNLAYEFAEVNGKWDANWLGFIGIKDDERKFSDRILGQRQWDYGWETLCVAPWLSMGSGVGNVDNPSSAPNREPLTTG